MLITVYSYFNILNNLTSREILRRIAKKKRFLNIFIEFILITWSFVTFLGVYRSNSLHHISIYRIFPQAWMKKSLNLYF